MSAPVGGTITLQDLLGPTPSPIQTQMALASEFEVCVVTGFGAGKTYGGCAAAIRHALRFPRARVLIARATYDELVRSTKHTFFELVRMRRLEGLFERPRRWDARESTNYARLRNGSEILFSNLDRAVERHKNVEYSMVVVDQAEEIPFETYQLLLLRLRLPHVAARQALLLANDEGDNWIRRRFLTFEPPHGTPPASAPRRLIRASSFVNPHLDAQTRQQYASLPPEIARRWVYATMEATSSRLLPDLPEVEPFVPPRHWPVWVGIDPARSTGITCAVFLAANPDSDAYRTIPPNGLVVWREYWAEGRDVEDHAQALQAIAGEAARPQAWVMDRTAWARIIATKRLRLALADLYMRAGIPVVPSQGDEWTRVGLILAAARRGCAVSTEATHLAAQLQAYRVRGQVVGGTLEAPVRIRNKQEFHAVDALGYALAAVPTRVGRVVVPTGPAIAIAPEADEASARHWAQWSAALPRRDSLVTYGVDEEPEIEGWTDPALVATPVDDDAY